MKKFISSLLAVFAIAFVSCEKDPDMDKLDSSIWFIPIMTRVKTSKLSKPITYRIAPQAQALQFGIHVTEFDCQHVLRHVVIGQPRALRVRLPRISGS